MNNQVGIVFAHHGLGDLVMLLPSLERLSQSTGRPGRIITLVKDNAAARLLELFNFHGLSPVVLNRRLAPLQALRLRLLRPEFLVAPQDYGGRGMKLLARLIRAKREALASSVISSAGCPKPENVESLLLHKAEIYAKTFALAHPQFGVDFKVCMPELPLSRVEKHLPDELRAMLTSKRVAVFAPGSGKIEAHKRWPGSHFARLADMLIEQRLVEHVILLGGPGERELLDEIRGLTKGTSQPGIIASGSVEMTLAILGFSHLLVSNCNGLSHLASLVRTRTVCLYGPTNPLFTGPFSSTVHVVRLRTKCSPCYRADFLTGCGTPVCMVEIAPELVATVCGQALNGMTPAPLSWDENSFAMTATSERRA